MERDTIGTEKAGEILGITYARVIFYIKAGRLSATKVGRDWVLRRADVERFAAIPRKGGRPLGYRPAKKNVTHTHDKDGKTIQI